MAMRLFVSVDLDGLAAPVADVQSQLPDVAGLRTTDPEQAHVTLKFLGDTDTDRVATVTGALETAVDESEISPFEATVGGLGVFPSMDYIRVVWVGLRDGQGDADLTALHRAVEAELVALGFDPEDHDFTPHATIARMDHAGGKEQVQTAVQERDPEVGTLQVEEIRLKESVLTDSGPDYRTVASVEL